MAACCLLLLVRFWLIRLDNYRIRSFILWAIVDGSEQEFAIRIALCSVIRFFFFLLSAERINRSHSSFGCDLIALIWFAQNFIAYWHKDRFVCVRATHMFGFTLQSQTLQGGKWESRFSSSRHSFVSFNWVRAFILCKWNHVNHVKL